MGIRSGELLAERYVVGEPIGEGSFGVVFRARDRWTSQVFAIKAFDGPQAVSLARGEFYLSIGAKHAGLARALDVGRFGDSVYIIYELVEGKRFDTALKGADLYTLLEVLDDLLSAISHLHAQNLIHGDLKPENIRIEWSNNHPVVRLLDLGLARPPGEVGGGNTAYGAPESLNGAATAVSDLFSIGVMTYEVISGGKLPFGDPAEAEYLSRLMQADPAPLDRSIPSGISEIINRLLAKDESARYRSAVEVREAFRSIMRIPPPYKDRPTPPGVIEREQTLSEIYRSLSDLFENGQSICKIAGPARSGRSTLLEYAVFEARLLGLHAIQVSAEAGLNPLLRQLLFQSNALGGGPEVKEAERLLAHPVHSIEEKFAPLFGVLRALEAVSLRKGLLIAVDDLDRADQTVTEAIHFLSSQHASGKIGRIGWILVQREDSSESVIPCSPLSRGGVATLLSAMLVGLEQVEEIAQIAHRDALGLVGNIVDSILHLYRSGAILFSDSRWAVKAEGLPENAFSPLSPHRVVELVETLEISNRKDLAKIALCGGPLQTAGFRLGLDPQRIAQLIEIGIDVRAVRKQGSNSFFSQQEVRDSLINYLSEEEDRELRTFLVHSLSECTDPADISSRAEHLYALGTVQEAANESLRAAEAAFFATDLHGASELYERACTWGGTPMWRKIGVKRAEVLAMSGDTDQAIAVLDEALTVGCPPGEVESARGCVLARAGRYDSAIQVFRKANVDNHNSSVDDRFFLGWSLMMRGFYAEAEELADIEPYNSCSDRARMGRLRGTVAWHRGDVDRSCAILEEALQQAKQGTDALVAVEVEQSLGTAERLRGNFSLSAAHYSEAIRLCRAAGFVPLLAKCLNNLAIVHYQTGKWNLAQRAWESMRELANRLDAKEEVLLAHNNLALLFKDRGELERAERHLNQAIDLSMNIGLLRYQSMAMGNRAEVLTLASRFDEAQEDLDSAIVLSHYTNSKDELLECKRRQAALSLAKGDHETALTQARDAALQAASLNNPVERGHAFLIACAAERALGRIEQADQDIGHAVELFQQCGTDIDRARVSLEKAFVDAACGRENSARKAAQDAANVFSEVGAERELTLARQIEEKLESTDRAQSLLGLLQIAAAAKDVDQLLDQTVQRLLEITCAERGCVVLLEGRERPQIAVRKSVPGVDEKLPTLSRGIADRVVASGRPLVLASIGDEVDLASRESVATLGLKTALCAPLKRGQRALGLLYVDSKKGSELVRFGMWILDAATAIIVPALERLIERDRERERNHLLYHAAIDALETVAAVDASLELLSEEDNQEERLRLVSSARNRVEDLTRRSEGLLDLIQSESVGNEDEPQTVNVQAVLGYLAEEFADRDIQISIKISNPPDRVKCRLESLSVVLTRIVDLISLQIDDGDLIQIRAEGLTEEDTQRYRQNSWRPGQSAGRHFLRIAFAGKKSRRQLMVDTHPVSPMHLSFKAAKRAIQSSFGRLLTDPQDGRFILELEAVTKEAA